MLDAESHRVFPAECAGGPEDCLAARVEAVGIEAEVRVADVVNVGRTPARQRARQFAYVGLGVSAAIRPQGEQLHQLARVVLVDRAPAVPDPVKPDQHRRIDRDGVQQIMKGAQRSQPEQSVLLQHQRLRIDVRHRRRKPVVPEQRHPLNQGLVRAHHPVQPPEVVVSVEVIRRQRIPVLVVRLRPAEKASPTGRVSDSTALRRPSLESLPGAPRRGPKAGPPQQPLGLPGAEPALIRSYRKSHPSSPQPRQQRKLT